MKVRIPNILADEYSMQLNSLHSVISQQYRETIEKCVRPKKVNVMLADASVTQNDTFDPRDIMIFYEMLTRKMVNWSSQGIAETNTNDLRRLHILFTTMIERYSLSCYVSMQYHALPFYKCDNKVKDIQIEIMELDEKITSIRQEMVRKENALVEKELKKRNIESLGFEEMLETMYHDRHLYNDLTKKVDDEENSNPEYSNMTKRRDELLGNLENMVIELYRTSSVLIDHNQLMQGEEGLAIYFDLEVIRKGEKSGTIEMKKMPLKIKQTIIERLNEVKQTLEELGEGNTY